MSSTFGDQPGDVVTSSRGDVLNGVVLSLYPTSADATAGTNLLTTVSTNVLGRWSYTHTTLTVVWVRTLDAQVYAVEDPTATVASAVATAGTNADTKIVTERGTERAHQSSTYGRALNLDTYPGVDPNGVTECAAAVQAAINAASAAGVKVVGHGYYKTASTLTFTDHADLAACVIDYTGTGLAILVGGVAGITRKTIALPYVVASAKTVTGWAQVAGSVGVKISNAVSCKIRVTSSSNFENGLLVYGENSSGSSYNEISLGEIANNKINLRVRGDGTAGWANQNTFIGGRVGHDGAEGTNVAGTRSLDMPASVPFVADGNLFVGTSFENPGVAEYILNIYGVDNRFVGCRWENYGTAKVFWGAGSARNVISGGYGVGALVEEVSGTTANTIELPPKTVTVTSGLYTVTTSDVTIISAGAAGITLPYAGYISPGRRVSIKNINASAVVVDCGGTVDGAASKSLAQWEGFTFIAVGLNWVTV